MNNTQNSIGKILDDSSAQRDAIHIAVLSAIANKKLYPGQIVGIENGKATNKPAHSIGIVDPFLDRAVYKEEKFWIFIYPNTVTNIRHDWKLEALDDTEIHRKWLEHYAIRNGYSYEEVIDSIKSETGLRFSDTEYEEELREAIEHYEKMTKANLSKEARENIITNSGCSC